MNIVKTVRNNWKKSLFAAVVSGYGIDSLKTHIEITQHMRHLCDDVANVGRAVEGVPKKVLVVMNPVANKKKAEKSFKKYCEPILHLAGYSVEILRTSHIGHAKTYVEDLASLPDVIVVAGGDGTTSEVVTGLMRRRGGTACPIALLPLGRTSQSASKYFSVSGKSELELAKTLSGALLPLLRNKFKYENVIQFDVLNEGDAEDKPKSLKPIYGLNRFSWGVIKDIDTSKDKYWYFGSLRHYAAAFLQSFSSSLKWNFATDYIYTPPCPGCSNCFVQRQPAVAPPSSGFLLSKLITPKNVATPGKERLARNENCNTKIQGRIEANQIAITSSKNELQFSELESSFINSLQPGWNFIKKIPDVTHNDIEPNLVLKSRTIQLYPADETDNIYYSIDGEEYDARPIKVSIVPNAIKVFC